MSAITIADVGERKRIAAKRRDLILSIASPLGLLAAWEIAARFHLIDVRFFPAPSSIVLRARVGRSIGRVARQHRDQPASG